MTGTVIDAGHGVTHVFPVCDGYVIGSCVRSIPLAGSDITKFIQQELKNRKEPLPAGQLHEIATKIKEQHCYVAKDLLKEYEKYDEKTKDEATGQLVQSSRFKKFTHKTLANKMVSVDVGYERFLAPEMFFHPEFIHDKWKTPLEEVVDEAIRSAPIDYRLKLYDNIVLSGGSTLFSGFEKRLNKNLQQILDNRMAVVNARTGGDTKIPVSVKKNLVQGSAVWFGGSMLASMEGFANICKTREMYAEHGPSICRYNPIFTS